MACPMGYHSLPEPESLPVFNHMSVLALFTVATLLATAYSICFALLRAPVNIKVRMIFTWHLFDALVHFTLGSSFLYNVFFTSMSTLDVAYTRGIHSLAMTPPGTSFLGDPKSLHGPFYGSSTTARLWQEYAKADKRRGGSDLNIISLELLTVFVMAPLSLLVCQLLRKQEYAKARYWMTVVATGELYGGIVALLPEWLAGSPNLDTSNFLTLWVYLIFFRSVWIVFPFWILWDVHLALPCPDQHSNAQTLNDGDDLDKVHSLQGRDDCNEKPFALL